MKVKTLIKLLEKLDPDAHILEFCPDTESVFCKPKELPMMIIDGDLVIGGFEQTYRNIFQGKLESLESYKCRTKPQQYHKDWRI